MKMKYTLLLTIISVLVALPGTASAEDHIRLKHVDIANWVKMVAVNVEVEATRTALKKITAKDSSRADREGQIAMESYKDLVAVTHLALACDEVTARDYQESTYMGQYADGFLILVTLDPERQHYRNVSSDLFDNAVAQANLCGIYWAQVGERSLKAAGQLMDFHAAVNVLLSAAETDSQRKEVRCIHRPRYSSRVLERFLVAR